MKPGQYYFSNCLVFSLSQWLKHPLTSSMRLEASLRPLKWHWLWISPNGDEWHFVRHSRFPGGVQPIWFKGRVKKKSEVKGN